MLIAKVKNSCNVLYWCRYGLLGMHNVLSDKAAKNFLKAHMTVMISTQSQTKRKHSLGQFIKCHGNFRLSVFYANQANEREERNLHNFNPSFLSSGD